MKRKKQMGLMRLGELPPRPLADVVQRAIRVDPDRAVAPQLPARCDKCGNEWLTLLGREVACRGSSGGCGRTWYLVAGESVEVRHVSERTIARHRAQARAQVA